MHNRWVDRLMWNNIWFNTAFTQQRQIRNYESCRNSCLFAYCVFPVKVRIFAFMFISAQAISKVMRKSACFGALFLLRSDSIITCKISSLLAGVTWITASLKPVTSITWLTCAALLLINYCFLFLMGFTSKKSCCWVLRSRAENNSRIITRNQKTFVLSSPHDLVPKSTMPIIVCYTRTVPLARFSLSI